VRRGAGHGIKVLGFGSGGGTDNGYLYTPASVVGYVTRIQIHVSVSEGYRYADTSIF